MALYVHAELEGPDGRRWHRGDTITLTELREFTTEEGIGELRSYGTLSDEPYEEPEPEPPETVVVDGVLYVRASDSGTSREGSKREGASS